MLFMTMLVPLMFGSVRGNETCLKDPCKCCRTNECSESVGNQCDGCIDGQTGKQCTIPCPENCVNCSQAFYDSKTDRTCFMCRNGYYNGKKHDLEIYRVNNDCSLSCKEGCSVCSSFHTCMQCNTGYYLISGENECKPCTRNCDICKSATDCDKCSDGYFWISEMCQQCKANCKTCTSFQDCIVCDAGFFLSEHVCTKCGEDCLQCNAHKVCQHCRIGYYLTHNISEHVCNKCQTGCSACDSASTCESCVPGHTMNNGQCYVCPSTCNVCEADNYSNCVICKDGYYNNNAQCQTCPKSCKACISNDKCTKCIDGFYGENCAHSCFENCNDNQCDKTSGQCITCRNGSYLAKNNNCVSCPAHCLLCQSQVSCQVCADGYNGEICEETCFNCKAGTRCGKTDGYCHEECIEGNSGPDCNIKCDSKCMTCDRQNSTNCKTCANNTYGIFCTKRCSTRCMLSTCNAHGFCTYGCKKGYWGKMCEFYCSEYCFGNVCSKNNELCSLGCKTNNSHRECICPSGCTCGLNGTCESSDVSQQENEKGLPLTAIIPASLVTAILIIVILYIIYKKRKITQQQVTVSIGNTIDSGDVMGLEMESSSHGEILLQQSVLFELPRVLPNNRNDFLHANRDVVYDEANQNEDFVSRFQNEDYSNQYEELRPIQQDANPNQNEDSNQDDDHVSKLSSELTNALVNSKKEEHATKDRHNERDMRESDDNISTCFIDGYKQRRAYISFVGPLVNYTCLCKIWKLVWQHKCSKIVMLCNQHEAQSLTCFRFVPSKGISGMNDIEVTCENENNFATYTVKTLKLQMQTEIRKLVYFNFIAWPKNETPDVRELVAFRSDVNNITSDGPTLVYCSFDEGCIGMYIALDMLSKECAAEGSIDLFRCVRNLREQRTSLISTADHYEYLHRAVACVMAFYTKLDDISRREQDIHQYEQCQSDTNEYITPI